MLPLCSVVCRGGPERRIFPLVRSGFDCQIMTRANKLWLKHLQLPQTTAAPPACPLSSVNIRSPGRFRLHCFDARLLCLFMYLQIFSIFLKHLFVFYREKSYFGNTFEKQYRPIMMWHKMVHSKNIIMCKSAKRRKLTWGASSDWNLFTVYDWNYS